MRKTDCRYMNDKGVCKLDGCTCGFTKGECSGMHCSQYQIITDEHRNKDTYELKEVNHINTVNSENFNQTMQGYVDYSLDFMEERLKEDGFLQEQIDRIELLFSNGLSWAKDEMTMEQARKYIKTY